MRCLLLVLIAILSFPAHAQAMRQAAEALLAGLPEASRAKVTRPFEDRDRLDWHYTPRSRNGAALKELDASGRQATHALLRTALSASGYRKAVNILELELVLREIETFGMMRDPERYHLTIYGKPDAKAAWGWRFEGHHLSLNFTLAGDRASADTPSFFGANPATVAASTKYGAKKGLRALAAEEDEARALLMKLIEVYAGSFEPALAKARLARVRDGGVENIRFGWAGATERGRQHYYRIQGPRFLIEYDASQNDGNHIHTVWRDFNGDFGRDLLRQHYAAAKGTTHRH